MPAGVSQRTAKAPRGSPSFGLPTEPQLTNSTSPYERTHGLCVWPRARTSASSAAELAVVGRDVRAAAVLEVARDRVVVVAVDRGHLALGDERDHLVGVRAVADEVAAAVDALDAERVDPRECGLQRG